jgi:hypothetical protein
MKNLMLQSRQKWKRSSNWFTYSHSSICT